MDTLLNAALSNAIAATILAVVAAAVGWIYPRPAVRHALWLLVLLKLVTPPLVDVPLSWPTSQDSLAAEVEEEAPQVWVDCGEAGLADLLGTVEEMTAPEPAAAGTSPSEPISWRPLVVLVWLTGSATWIVLAVVRGRRFRRLLGHTRRAPAWLQEEANRVARRLGLLESPVVWLVPGRVSPMLWAVGGAPRLLVPERLLDRLDAQGRQALLAHELAHLLRRDHWVRLFETLTAALYWWHPAVWWARRALREAEEQCCDAWAVWVQPGAARSYALTLVETIDFLSESQAPLPALASGLGHGDDLRRRVIMIMQGSTPRTLGWRGLLSVLTVGAFLLPVVPVWGQEKKEEKKKEERRVIVLNSDEKYSNVQELVDGKGVVVFPRGDGTTTDRVVRFVKVAQETQDEVTQLKMELEKKRAELAALEARLHAVAARRKAEAVAKEEKAAKEAKTLKTPKESKEPAGDSKKSVRILILDGGKERVIEVPPGADILKHAQGKVEIIKEAVKKAEEKIATTDRVKQIGARDLLLRLHQPGGDQAARLADLEKKLSALLKEVEQIRREVHRPVPPAPLAVPKPPIPPAGIR